ncbi:MAG: hypothetical protein KQH57_17055 [Actinomycetales bacterium]|nr:hypothetical protein [Actinomycetales bacterium]
MNLTDALARIAGRSADVHGAGTGLDLGAVLAEARRRRRRFTAVTTVAAAAVVALLAAGGVALGSIDATPVPPATTESTSSPTSAGWGAATTVAAVPACGDPTPQLDRATNPQLWFSSSVLGSGLASGNPADQLVQVDLMTTGLPDGYAMAGRVPVTYALVLDDRVVSVAEAQWTGEVASLHDVTTALFRPCPGVDTAPGPGGTSLLKPGAYQLFAVAQLSPQKWGSTTLGGPGTLLVAASPAGVRLGGPLEQPAAAPALPTCGADASGLSATPQGPLELYTTIVPAGGDLSFDLHPDPATAPAEDSFTASAFVSTTVARVGQDRVTWVAVQGGAVVAQGDATFPVTPGLAGNAGPNAQLPFMEPLSGLTDCRTGGPLSGAYELWVRADLGLDTAPMLEATDPSVSLIAAPVWATTDPQPIPAAVPIVGDGATLPQGVAVVQTRQTDPHEWTAVTTFGDSASKAQDQVRQALAAAGITESNSGPGSSLLGFDGHGFSVTVSVGDLTGGGVVTGLWDIRAE